MCYFPPIKPTKAAQRLTYLANKFPQYKIITDIYILMNADEWIESLKTLLQQNEINFIISKRNDALYYITINTHKNETVHTHNIYLNDVHYCVDDINTIPFIDVPFQSNEINKEIYDNLFMQ
ncbi:hypothetical protein QKU48_gp1036 [Fadolivirus algeromassiliense]|jgi:hypothetical protein|uniref:Uncharacterized protein n=1 Tax=Fadolivirus FV1/VV64 TaxID=3070911 RepID=A0A7D3UW14_9VIRU|nr:hypothetical protein QKU48_gp1036 [Fadolivirus algeromassiliense]QKF94494.1 hypothetical protein Fadolivirus_1_1036 [Fadolivirus FV1/VV64]